MYQRALVQQLRGRLQEPRRFIQIVVGPRQTGKTTAVDQAIAGLGLAAHVVSADDPTILDAEWVRREWDTARSLQASVDQPAVLVIDEIQKIDQWSGLVKLLWDEDSRAGRSLLVVLTGSSPLLLQRGLAESLAGRFEVLHCPHWNFAECREAFGYTLDDFLFFGGYPGAAVLHGDETRWVRYLGASIVEPTISQDVLAMGEIRKPALLRSLFILGATYSAQELSLTKVQGRLQDAGNTATLAHYLTLLDKAGMLTGLPKFQPTPLATRASSPRFMVYDTSLMVYATGASRRRLLDDSTLRGHLVESAVGAYLLARGAEEGFAVSYWRERAQEVDFVIQRGTAVTAIEVKSGGVKTPHGSLAFMKAFPKARGIVVGSPAYPLADVLAGRVPLFG
ncbi:MAG: DUF4143 domain-containing protein [Propionibacteriaceae bacterium]|nr:DUF4143 domain-containing protein [Propionibacteriaceae bacterium]